MGLWLGPRLHVVHYPVRGGEWLNVVVLVEATDATQFQDWDMPTRGCGKPPAI
jgi:salicylate hydroxylase